MVGAIQRDPLGHAICGDQLGKRFLTLNFTGGHCIWGGSQTRRLGTQGFRGMEIGLWRPHIGIRETYNLFSGPSCPQLHDFLMPKAEGITTPLSLVVFCNPERVKCTY